MIHDKHGADVHKNRSRCLEEAQTSISASHIDPMLPVPFLQQRYDSSK